MTVLATVIKTVYDLLSQDSGVESMVGKSWIVTLYGLDPQTEDKGVYPDQVPTGEALPYIVFGNSSEKVDYTMGGLEYDVSLSLFIWSSNPDMFKALDLLAEMERVLDGQLDLGSDYYVAEQTLTSRNLTRQNNLVWYVETKLDLTIQKVN